MPLLSVRRLQTGFTLVEVLVALAIVAMALPALMLQISTQLEGRRSVQDQIIASWVAQEQLALIKLQSVSGQSISSASQKVTGEVEMANRRWYWQHSVQATEVPDLFRHQLRVSGDSPVQVELEAYLAWPAELTP